MMAISVKNLKKYYGRSRGVDDATFDVAPGEIMGFIGPNGAGKTTVIRVLAGLLNKTAGTAEVLGLSPGHEANRHVGYMPGEMSFYGELTVRDQLLYLARVRGVPEENVERLARRLDLDLKRRVRDLSTGNRKKIGIVVALMHSPRVLIFDEPTSGLDPLIQKEFFDLLREEKSKGAAILLSSHVLSEVEKACDRICLIRDGRTLFTETLADLKREKYKRVFVTPGFADMNLSGLKLASKDSNQAVYHYRGDINPLLEALSYYRLADVKIEDLDLEEIFIHYYRKEEGND
ncbi:MAG: ABC transporter ATP-binding protein [Bacilli bacterium]|jgi:ABC-2 type transport system ATP-binding protein|nr:ABC transporter ATP-binding protein [Acholeplasmataceae bacterium]HOA79053.1 ABC transporter ATP-binding protein [Bacilli bacterium]HPZ27669.1 ABC transporter ATP-binding protein [Bacilli bacterium]HQC90119.1 ABC transporter ATP-binding protein [Bacilli bacterium]